MNEHESEFGGVGNRGLPHGFGEQEAYLSGSSTVSSPTKLEVQYGRAADRKPTPAKQARDSQRAPKPFWSTSETQEKIQRVPSPDSAVADHDPGPSTQHPLHPPKSSTKLAPGAESLGGVANIKNLARRNHELSAQFRAQRSDHSETEKRIWQKKYDMEVESGKEKQAEIERLRRELESVNKMVNEERQNNWDLQYELQDALEEVRVLQRRLMTSIPARLQGQSRDDEEDDNTAGTGFSTGLAWERYENATIKELKDKVRALRRDRDNGRLRH